MADAGYQICVDAGGVVRKKSLGGGKYKNICFHHGKAYHSDVKDGNVQKNQNNSNKQINDKDQTKDVNRRAENVGSHNL